ncbi:LADA_0A02586g1_1 [Lachancea dasiensis]|uniref:LADA_0A02586g1_1 n=1 Tax=Lachancea dasiensis TaxID=1072105 RepID=A0A1G4IMI4_9SACH|nr:LADA_0A02586g1_1 [Lachancea dasiensis]
MSDYQATGENRTIFQRKNKAISLALKIAVLVILTLVSLTVYKLGFDSENEVICTECDSYGALEPAFTSSLDKILYNREYKQSIIDKLAGAIQIPTEIFDDSPEPSPDVQLWQNFQKLHDYLEQQFPELYAEVDVEKVGGYGLLYTWKGLNSTLKPLVLMAHQDVVPVEPSTVDLWTHPPFSGFYNETEDLIYGRGACDTKPLVISHLEAVELLIKDGFKPQRTVLISLGCDEEAAGACAAKLAEHIEKKYGRDSVYAILDEGGGVLEENGSYFALPMTAEKGYLDAEITLFTPGGHSSVPPDHTSIGILSEFMVDLEKDIYETHVGEHNPALDMLKCLTKFGAIKNKDLERHLLNSASKKKLAEALDAEPVYKYLFKTSQALDIISGGIKANALPESVSVLLNNRIDIQSSVNETAERILGHIRATADKFDLGIEIMIGRDAKEGEVQVIKPTTPNGHFIFKLMDPLEPAPVSPTLGSEIWKILAGTTVSTYKTKAFGGKHSDVYLTPGMGGGNTDTKSYWNLTKNIYRYGGALALPGSNEHTVDEKNSGASLVSGVAFMYQFIPNVDIYSTEA